LHLGVPRPAVSGSLDRRLKRLCKALAQLLVRSQKALITKFGEGQHSVSLGSKSQTHILQWIRSHAHPREAQKQTVTTCSMALCQPVSMLLFLISLLWTPRRMEMRCHLSGLPVILALSACHFALYTSVRVWQLFL
jgi:hypothetical protein